jgi:hypothetical protein
MNMMSPQPHAVSKDLQTALGRFGVTFPQADPLVSPVVLYDATGLWLGGVANVGAWGSGCGRGIAYQDHGPVTDGQKGAIRKISSGRKARGMASHDRTQPGIF